MSDQIGITYKEAEEDALVNFKFVQIKKQNYYKH